MTTKNRLDVALDIKSVTDTGEFTGYGSVFNVKDAYGDVVVKGAFQKSLAQWKLKDRLPAMLWQHKMNEPIGIYTKMEEDDCGLYFEGKLLIDCDELAKRAYGHMKAGSLSGMSIGYVIKESDYDQDQGVFYLKEIDLWELSLVTFPANDDARVQDVKNALRAGDELSPSRVERVLRDAGFNREKAKAFMADGYKGICARDATGDDLKSDIKSVINIYKR